MPLNGTNTLLHIMAMGALDESSSVGTNVLCKIGTVLYNRPFTGG